ncbi:MAG: methyltransferase domain-containing protein [Deltaproteobacteria bacterium]|nr:methyltransferase domain-containing protein [Deltaproteobacteria bacterium]
MRPRSDTLLVWTGANCTYGCPACPIAPSDALPGLQVVDLQHGLSLALERDSRMVLLAGGEPFLRPDFLRLIAAVRAAGYAAGVVTTGRGLVYPQLRQKLRRLGLAYLRIQMFGYGAVHDQAVALPGAFEQALSGLRAWLAEGDGACDVDVALTLRGRPMEAIESEIESLGTELGSLPVQLVVAAGRDACSAPAYLRVLRHAVSVLAAWNDDASRPLLVWEGLPAEVAATAGLAIPASPLQFVAPAPAACCLGRADEQRQAAIVDGGQTRANSFNFVRTATQVPWQADPTACRAYDVAGKVGPGRQVWLIEGDDLILHTTDTGDFTPSEIARIKDEWSHIFVDLAPPGRLDDFTDGMRRVLPDFVCSSCEHRADCGKRFHVVDGPPYAREEQWIAAHIAGLRGRVLDVGCGEQLYRDTLAPLVRSGVVQYTGLDPDEPSIAKVREVLPAGRFHLCGIEEFSGTPASYDHILCLRSLNHVVDVDEAVGRMATLLKPGGSLLMVECTPFAMLRRAEQVAAADRAPRAGHQHLRNLASEEVLPFARRHLLRIVEHQPAALQSTNEWILLLQKPVHA